MYLILCSHPCITWIQSRNKMHSLSLQHSPSVPQEHVIKYHGLGEPPKPLGSLPFFLDPFSSVCFPRLFLAWAQWTHTPEDTINRWILTWEWVMLCACLFCYPWICFVLLFSINSLESFLYPAPHVYLWAAAKIAQSQGLSPDYHIQFGIQFKIFATDTI